MGEIMDEYYDRAWAASGAAHDGANQAINELQPQIDDLRERLEDIELLLGLTNENKTGAK